LFFCYIDKTAWPGVNSYGLTTAIEFAGTAFHASLGKCVQALAIVANSETLLRANLCTVSTANALFRIESYHHHYLHRKFKAT
jgi:hypothetical protein